MVLYETCLKRWENTSNSGCAHRYLVQAVGTTKISGQSPAVSLRSCPQQRNTLEFVPTSCTPLRAKKMFCKALVSGRKVQKSFVNVLIDHIEIFRHIYDYTKIVWNILSATHELSKKIWLKTLIEEWGTVPVPYIWGIKLWTDPQKPITLLEFRNIEFLLLFIVFIDLSIEIYCWLLIKSHPNHGFTSVAFCWSITKAFGSHFSRQMGW